MSGGMEMDPEAIQAFATVLAHAKSRFDLVVAEFDQPNAVAEDFGRSWHDQGNLFVNSWGELGSDLASLSALLEQIQANLGQSAELVVTGETAKAGEFERIGDTPGPRTEESSSAGSMGGFPLSDAFSAYTGKLVDARTISESFEDVIRGPRLDKAVRETVPGYVDRLDLGDPNVAKDQRARLLDLNWGKIEADAGMLSGLGAAVADVSAALSSGAAIIGETWKGSSYEAFNTAVGKITTTLNVYADGATITGDGLTAAMSNIRDLYQIYAQDTVDKHLNFDEVTHSPPENWHKVTNDADHNYSPLKLGQSCCGMFLCDKYGASMVLVNTYITDYQWGTCLAATCDSVWPSDAAGTIGKAAEECAAAVKRIDEKIGAFKGITDETVRPVTEMMDLAVGNLVELTQDKVLSSLSIVGGSGGTAPAGGGDYPGGGAPGGSYPGGGGGGPVGGGGSMPMATPPPIEVPEVPEVTAPAAAEPPATEPPVEEPAAGQQETVRIQDGDRAISVSSPDGTGQVRVTVEDASGATKSYSLDFDAASGLLPMGQDPASAEQAVGPDGQSVEDEVQKIPASTNGKCVIEDGPLTITAERPLFAPDSLRLVVDDGTGDPTTYTVDFAEQNDEPPTGLPDVAPGPAPAGEPVAQEAAAEQVTAEPEVPAEEPAEEAAPVAESSAAEALVAEEAPAAEPEVTEQPETPPVDAVGTTTPQSDGDGTGAMSGRLPDPGEAELGTAEDGDDSAPAGAAAGMPMLGGAGAPSDSGESGGRLSSGWSVHGDLFDSTEPVYSMHGVLGDDDRDAEQVSR